MTLNPCDALSDRMPDVASGSARWTREEASHLASCQECILEWQLVQRTAVLGDGVAASVDPDAMAHAVIARLVHEARVVPLRRAGWWAAGLVAAAAAVVLLLRPVGDPDPAVRPSPDVVWLVPELDSLETTELMVVLDSFDPDTPGGALVGAYIDDLEHQELEQVLQAWEG